MTHDQLIVALQGIAEVLDGEQRQAIQLAIDLCRKKDPGKLALALAEFEYELGRRRGDPAFGKLPEIERDFYLAGAVRLVRFMQSWSRDPEVAVSYHARQAKRN